MNPTAYVCIRKELDMCRFMTVQIHKWTDMTEWAFLGYQERKKVLLERITNRQFIWIKIKIDREKKCTAVNASFLYLFPFF